MKLDTNALLNVRQGEAMEETGAALLKFLFHIKVTISPYFLHRSLPLCKVLSFTAIED